MNIRLLVSALALGSLVAPGVALADDPKDPTMRNSGARGMPR